MISAQNDVVIDLHCTTITRDSKYRDPYDIESWTWIERFGQRTVRRIAFTLLTLHSLDQYCEIYDKA